jgi:hypothetical protein
MAYKNSLYDWFDYFFWKFTKKWRMKRKEYNKLSCSFNKLKDELIYFHFYNRNFSYYCSFNLEKKDERIKYSYEYVEREIEKEGFYVTFPKDKYNEFIRKIYKEKIYKWKRYYFDEESLRQCSDQQVWSLKMEFTNLPEFSSHGLIFPTNWDKFITILKEYIF